MNEYRATSETTDSEPDLHSNTEASFDIDTESKPSSEASNWMTLDVFQTDLEALNFQEVEDSLRNTPKMCLSINLTAITSTELDYSLIEAGQNGHLASSLPVL